VARITIDAPGDYAVSVLGNDPAINAAIGDDPDDGVDRLRRGAIAAVIVGLVVGGLLLWLAGRRSRKAATFMSPIDPGWGVTERDRQRRAAAATEWAAPISGSQQVPVNPHQPDERRTVSPADPSADGVWASPPESDLPEPVLAGSTPAHAVADDHAPHADPAGTVDPPSDDSNQPDASIGPVELADQDGSDDVSNSADQDASDVVSDSVDQDGSEGVSGRADQDGSGVVSDSVDQDASDDVTDSVDTDDSPDQIDSDGRHDPTPPGTLGEVGDASDQIDSDERHDPNAAAEPEGPTDDGS
jgi:hypothetical protein